MALDPDEWDLLREKTSVSLRNLFQLLLKSVVG